jgi:hypothetical protein
LQRVFANLKADFFVSQVSLDPNPLIFQGIRNFFHVGLLAIGDA